MPLPTLEQASTNLDRAAKAYSTGPTKRTLKAWQVAHDRREEVLQLEFPTRTRKPFIPPYVEPDRIKIDIHRFYAKDRDTVYCEHERTVNDVTKIDVCDCPRSLAGELIPYTPRYGPNRTAYRISDALHANKQAVPVVIHYYANDTFLPS